MPRALHHPVVQAAAVAHYLPVLSDPLHPLAEQVGKVVAARVLDTDYVTGKGGKKARSAPSTPRELETEISVLVANELDRLLSLQTAEGKAIRMALIAKLAGSEMGSAISAAPSRAMAADAMLTTAEAAAKLEVSRPYVSMLCDQGKLGEVVVTEGGHRRVRSSAVDAYLSARTKQHEGAKSPREAAADAGLYDYPEGHFSKAVRARSVKNAVEEAPVKAVRKSRK